MAVQAGFARIAALLADPVREAILVALADGRALPAGELADLAGVTPQSASGHLRKLVEGGVVSVWSQGRFRYFRLANAQVGAALETLAGVAATAPRRAAAAPIRPPHLITARCCYNHLAGRLGVTLAEGLQQHGYVQIAGDAVTLTGAGERWAMTTGFIAGKAPPSARQLRLCLDWTERRFHFAGSLANAILKYLLANGHLKRGRERSLIVTASGKAWFGKLGLDAEPRIPQRRGA